MKKIISILSVITVCFFAVSKPAYAANDAKKGSCDDHCWGAEYKTANDGTKCNNDAECNTPANLNALNAKTAVCVEVFGKSKKKSGQKYCVATNCSDDSMMWIGENKYSGVCHKKNICEVKGFCPKNCKEGCKPHMITDFTSVASIAEGVVVKSPAYDYCTCGGFSCGDRGCVWKGTVEFYCPDGVHKVEFAEKEGIKTDKEASDLADKLSEQYNDQAIQLCKAKGWSGADKNTKSKKLQIANDFGNGGNSGGSASVSGEQTNKLSKASDNLSKLFNDIDSGRSVWKNADGSFNATRLASDLTAGVVLGTVGGVVSGVLIKKSQVEKGFDALNCTVGGQKIADWGDEFRVGLRR